MKYCRVLTIAGSDSGGGAGIQADIKTISACGAYASSVITAVTAQSTLGVSAIHPIPTDIIEGQIEAVLSDIGADAIKIGMLHCSAAVEVVARAIDRFAPSKIVLDPVMVSTSGHRLIEDSAVEMICSRLIPRATVITPNIPEAEVLLGYKINGASEIEDAALALASKYECAVLLKAGHLEESELTDILCIKGHITRFSAKRIESKNTHGTGCTLSSALASFLARGYDIEQSTALAKDYLYNAILSGAHYSIGEGHGAVNHLWQSIK